MHTQKLAGSLLISFIIIVATPVFGEGATKTFIFDELTFCQAGKRLFTNERKSVYFPVKLELRDGTFWSSRVQGQEKIEVTYRTFPAALTGFIEKERLEKRRQKRQNTGDRYPVNIFACPDHFPILANKAMISNPRLSSREKERDGVVVFTRLLFMTDLSYSDEIGYKKIMGWFDTLETAAKEGRPVDFVFSIPPLAVVGTREDSLILLTEIKNILLR